MAAKTRRATKARTRKIAAGSKTTATAFPLVSRWLAEIEDRQDDAVDAQPGAREPSQDRHQASERGDALDRDGEERKRIRLLEERARAAKQLREQEEDADAEKEAERYTNEVANRRGG